MEETRSRKATKPTPIGAEAHNLTRTAKSWTGKADKRSRVLGRRLASFKGRLSQPGASRMTNSLLNAESQAYSMPSVKVEPQSSRASLLATMDSHASSARRRVSRPAGPDSSRRTKLRLGHEEIRIPSR